MSHEAMLLRDLLAQVGLADWADEVGEAGRAQVPREPTRPPPLSLDVQRGRAHTWAEWGVPAEAIWLLQHPEQRRQTQALWAARDLAVACTEGRTWGLLAGGVGSGKSVAAGWWLTEVRCRRGQGRVYCASEDVAALPVGTVYAEQRLEMLMQANALVLDDVGTGDGLDGHMHPVLQRLLRRRYELRLPTLCTTNLHPVKDWPAYLGDSRLVDRWNEIGEHRVTTEKSLRTTKTNKERHRDEEAQLHAEP